MINDTLRSDIADWQAKADEHMLNDEPQDWETQVMILEALVNEARTLLLRCSESL